jgi:hypothetical protein
MLEKIVRSLDDLEEAVAAATRDGGCRIWVGDRVLSLVVSEDLNDQEAEEFLNHPGVIERLNRASDSLDKGRGIPHEEVLRRFGGKTV